MKQPQGLTLIELVAASLLGLVIILALGQVDVARVRLYEENKRMGRRTTDPTRGEPESGFALQRIIRDIKQADRVVLRDLQDVPDGEGRTRRVSSRIQIRIPEGRTLAELNDLARYRWVQYRLDAPNRHVLFYNNIVAYDPDFPGLLRKVDANCATPVGNFRDVENLEMRYLHIAKPALGGDPFPEGRDNNVLEIIISSIDQFKFGATTVPAVAYANVHTACFTQGGEAVCDSGSGLAPVSGIPPCP